MKLLTKNSQVDGGKLININVGDFRIGYEERTAIMKVLDSGRISEGKFVRDFENCWSKYIGTKYSVTLNSGTSALISGLTALKYHSDLNINSNSKVITTPLSYVATSNAIVLTGFKPIYVDIEKYTFGITPENIKAHLEQVDDPSEYSVILPVHLMGYPCDMKEINKIAKKYGLVTFEDSSQSHSSKYNGKKTGSLSLLSCFSFYIAHNIQAGELGSITTDDYEIIRLIRKIKANGRICDCPVCTRSSTGCPKMNSNDGDDLDPRFTHDLIGYNFKTTEFNAALALTQLEKADWIAKRRNENVKYLNEGLEKLSDVLELPTYSEDISYLAYPLVIKDHHVSRKKLRINLAKKGIETRPLFGCIPNSQPAYSQLKNQYIEKLPIADYIGSNGFYIGCHQYLGEYELNYIINIFMELLK